MKNESRQTPVLAFHSAKTLVRNLAKRWAQRWKNLGMCYVCGRTSKRDVVSANCQHLSRWPQRLAGICSDNNLGALVNFCTREKTSYVIFPFYVTRTGSLPGALEYTDIRKNECIMTPSPPPSRKKTMRPCTVSSEKVHFTNSLSNPHGRQSVKPTRVFAGHAIFMHAPQVTIQLFLCNASRFGKTQLQLFLCMLRTWRPAVGDADRASHDPNTGLAVQGVPREW